MIYLAASIISSSSIFILFRFTKKFNVKLIPLITINYLTACVWGVLITSRDDVTLLSVSALFPYAIILGTMFIAMFWLIGLSSRKTGITVTTLASKMSLIFPVTLSLLLFQETVTPVKVAGILLAIAAAFLSIYRTDMQRISKLPVVLPLLIFIGGGFNDSLIKYVQALHLSDASPAAFTTGVFGTAFLSGLVLIFTGDKPLKQQINIHTLLFGLLLGLANFGSLYFLIEALVKSRFDSSLVFTLNNMLIVVFSALAGRIFFREQLNRINIAGFVLALLSLAILL